MSLSRNRTGPFVLASVLLSSATAYAQEGPPAEALSPLPPSNLRLSMACADNPFVTPDAGLDVTVDGGGTLSPGKVDYGISTAVTPHGHEVAVSVPTDVAYVAPPGSHQLRIVAPGCAAVTRSVELLSGPPLLLDGALPTSPELRGPVDAPDGLRFTLGGFESSFPKSLRSGATSATAAEPGYFAADATHADGFAFSTGFVHRHFVGSVDLGMGGGSYSGTITPNPGSAGLGVPAGPTPYAGNFLMSTFHLRAGARLPLHYVALEAGSGIGGSLWFTNAKSGADPGFDTSNVSGAHGIWGVPLWASVEVKPSCSWGLDFTASYDVEPTNFEANTLMFQAGLVLEPAAACSRAPSLRVVQP